MFDFTINCIGEVVNLRIIMHVNLQIILGTACLVDSQPAAVE